MPKIRKTLRTADLVDTLNRSIAYSAEHNPADVAERHTLAMVASNVLHTANAYGGFRYLDGHEAVATNSHDESAREYFVKAGLR